MLDGIRNLPKRAQIPDDIFYAIFEIEDIVERTQFLEHVRMILSKNGKVREFNNIYKAYVTDYIQRQKQTGNKTAFTDQPLALDCGPWTATDMGIYETRYDNKGYPHNVYACQHPILPTEILKNVDTNEERITLAYFKTGSWQKITVNRCVCANTNKIVDVLSQQGIEVTSENAKNLVRYLSDCVGMNPATLKPTPSIGRLGWIGNDFTPYTKEIRYEGDPDYEVIFKNIRQAGDYDLWRTECLKMRENLPLRLMMAASFASCLLEPLGVLPFVLHVWGASGTCKTVALMVAMSIWGNPRLGGLVKTMNMTKNAIMRNAAFLCSIPFAGDELQTIKDKWQGNFDQLIYQVTEGIDRGRARAAGGVEETRTWKNSFIFTGEEPITKANSNGGSKNRVIEVAIDGPLVDDGHAVSELITKNYGFAGHRFVEYIQQHSTEDLTKRYKELFGQICELDTTDKQAMAMATILVADELAVQLIFPEEQPIPVADIQRYLQSAKEVDVAARAYEKVMNWIAKNPVRFEDPKADDSANKGEVWGKIDGSYAVVDKDVLTDFLDKSGFDYTAVSKKWAEKEQLKRNSQGKLVHQTKVYGIKASYLKIKLENEEKTDEDFLPIEQLRRNAEQMELPFD